MRIDDDVLAIVYLLALMINNALCTSTTGITDKINQYYGLENGSFLSTLPESVYYFAYLVCFPICDTLGQGSKGLERVVGIAIGLTTMGACLRLKGGTDSFTTLIVSNGLIGLAQPLLLNFTSLFAHKKISRSYRFRFIGAASAFFAMGVAVGYPIPVWMLANSGTDSVYESKFNQFSVYFAIASGSLLLAFIASLIFQCRMDRLRAARQAQTDRALRTNGLSFTTPVTPSTTTSVTTFVAPSNDTMMDILDELRHTSSGTPSAIADRVSPNSVQSGGGVVASDPFPSIPLLPLWIFLIVYAVTNSISQVTSNYQELFLAAKGYSSDQVFQISLANLIPAVPIPILVGYLLDKCRRFYLVTGICLIIQCASQVVFLYAPSGSTAVIYASLIVNGSTGACLTSVFVTLITEYATSTTLDGSSGTVTTSGSGERSLTWNNRTISSSILLMLLITLIPLPIAEYQTFYNCITAAMGVSCLVYCVNCRYAMKLD